MPAIFQTPGTFVLAGGGAFWSGACRAALASCGIDPDAFGTYKQRARAQAKARAAYRKQRIAEAEETPRRAPGRDHEANCKRGGDRTKLCMCHESASAYNDFLDGRNGAPPNPTGSPNAWLTANSESGHISGNAFYQDAGQRGDPCANTRPTKDPTTGKYTNAGSYGYQDDQAFCMDHFGRANEPGTVHHQVTCCEANHSNSLNAAGINVVTENDLLAGVEATVAIALHGADARLNGKVQSAWDSDLGTVTAQSRARSEALVAAQEQNAKSLLQREADAGNVDAQKALAATGASGPAGVAAADAQRQMAKECIVAAWKKSLDEMRDEAINKHSTVGKSAQCKKAVREYNQGPPKRDPEARGFTDLPAKTQDDLLKKTEAARADKEKKLASRGAESAGKQGEAGAPPTGDDCLEYQGNWLLAHRTPGGGYPPMQGTPQGQSGPGPGSTAPVTTADPTPSTSP